MKFFITYTMTSKYDSGMGLNRYGELRAASRDAIALNMFGGCYLEICYGMYYYATDLTII